MSLQRLSSRLLLSMMAIVAVSAAQSAPRTSPAPMLITGCTQYLQLTAIQHRVIDGDEARIDKLKLELQLLTGQPAASQPGQDREIASPPAAAPASIDPVQVKIYEDQIRRLTKIVNFNREGVGIVEDIYRDCIKKPPRHTGKPAPQAR
jgi:hypothetical protein